MSDVIGCEGDSCDGCLFCFVAQFFCGEERRVGGTVATHGGHRNEAGAELASLSHLLSRCAVKRDAYRHAYRFSEGGGVNRVFDDTYICLLRQGTGCWDHGTRMSTLCVAIVQDSVAAILPHETRQTVTGLPPRHE